MWPDNETATDLLGFDVHANLIRAVITDDSMLPLTIGVFGDWGGGKTSIMKMLEESLDPDTYAQGSPEHSQCSSIATVYVNTWQFEGYDDAKAALLSAVLLELKEHKRFGPKVRDRAVTLLRSVNWLRFGRLTMKHVAVPAAAAFFTGGAAAIPAALAVATGLSQLLPAKTTRRRPRRKARLQPKPAMGQIWKDFSRRTPTKRRQRTFEHSGLSSPHCSRTAASRHWSCLSTIWTGAHQSDCWRTSRPSSCSLLSTIQRSSSAPILASSNMPFVFGTPSGPPTILTRTRPIALSSTILRNSFSFLTLPRLSPSEIESYMALLFCQKHLESDRFKTCLARCDANRVSNRYQTFGFGEVQSLLGTDVVQGDFAGALQFCATAAPAIAEGLKGNPRQVKRFLNAFLLRKQLALVARLDDIRDDVLIKLMILEYAHLDRFRELFDWQSADNGFPKSLGELEAALESESTSSSRSADQGWSTPAVRKWLAMEPRLSRVDLRNYFG